MQARKGEIKINGQTFLDDPSIYRKQMAYITEQPILYDELTLYEHLKLTTRAYGLSEVLLEERLPKLLKEFRIERQVHWLRVNFSKGMRQKVMIMCAFLIEPELYIVDEPFVGSDPLSIQSYLELMEEMKDSGSGILMSTHILATAEKYCDRFIIIHEGRIRATGTIEELREEFDMSGASLDD